MSPRTFSFWAGSPPCPTRPFGLQWKKGRRIGGATVSLALRIFTLALLFAWQAVAIGASGPAHFCQRQVETHAAECHCPHGEAKAAASHDETALRADCCDEPGWELPAPVMADVSNGSVLLAVPPAPVPTRLVFQPVEGGRILSLARWDTPHAQGPPVFLRIRSLLI